ncbi:hypothetical protein NPIL_248211 [Nephila pilipes]|uniref:Uncharacterized protein n=1 Tax=Nephila pilipes TaxID=299642 RepID=A0A8X6PIF7_NEPPI|nr:hypothetical protein NPIL_248211 [Nephila pilipes]
MFVVVICISPLPTAHQVRFVGLIHFYEQQSPLFSKIKPLEESDLERCNLEVHDHNNWAPPQSITLRQNTRGGGSIRGKKQSKNKNAPNERPCKNKEKGSRPPSFPPILLGMGA